MSTENTLSSQESLQIINSMIREARKSFSKTAVFFLIWGVILAVAGVMEYFLMQSQYQHPYIVWPIAGVLGGIISGIIGRNQSMEKGTTTVIDRVIFSLWTSFFITLVLFIVGCVLSQVNPGPYIIILTGLPTLVTGMVLRFKPLILGGIAFWIMGLLSFFIPNGYIPLFFSLSMIMGYIIPGFILRKAERDGSL